MTQPPPSSPLSASANSPVASPGYPNLGFDPAPGNPAVVGRLSSELGEVATKLETAKDALRETGHSYGIWRGGAAEAFRNQVGELPDHLDTAGDSMRKASRVLGDWSDDLSAFQRNGRELEDLARVAKRNLENAQNDPGLLEADRTYTDSQQLAAAQSRLDAALDRLRRAQSELDAIIERAEALARRHRELVELAARALDDASRDAPEEGFFERLGKALDAIVDGIEDLAADIWKYIQDNADLINEISNTLSTLSTVLGVAAAATFAFPPLSAALGSISLGLGAAALAGHALAKAAGADVTWTTIALDAFGVATGGAGKLIGATGDAVEAAAKSADAAGDSLSAAGKFAAADDIKAFNIGFGFESAAFTVGTPMGMQLIGVEDSPTNIFQDVYTYMVPKTPSEVTNTLIYGPAGGAIANTILRDTP
ncbi:putative T7SS-secreted protein [Rhodococcus sp. NPDC049939]|uniref:putative T7SS-secreted protein n=1 Tax=Rhodococcus sp. NPDC049939 TaxID=3155511 RepID=UPI0033EFB121